LKPREDFAQKLESFQLEIQPTPTGQADSLDLFNNHQTTAWFSGQQSQLTLRTHFKVHTTLSNPFHYLITDPQVLKLPAKYSLENQLVLAPFLRPQPDKSVENLAQTLVRESDDSALSFLYHMTDYLKNEFHHIIRPQGDPLPAHKTLQRKEGACRDLAVLFMDLCRSLGLAARFVSGYKYDPDSKDKKELHAWAEVYLPGAGWRGYDPTWGLAVAEQHIPLVSGPTAQDAEPITGTFRGTGVLSRMDYEVEIKSLEPQPKAFAV